MKLLWAVLAYLAIGLFLCWGMVQAVNGNFWLLTAGFLAYMVAFTRIGCLPKKSH
jgi:hypothetical protein